MINAAEAKVLITGGTSGIGRGLAERFLRAGAKVLVTGRNLEKLEAMAQIHPNLMIFQNDIKLVEGREALALHIDKVLPDLNVLINNGGIQRRVGLAEDEAPWSEKQAEIDILFCGPVHLTSLLLPKMLQTGSKSFIVNVTSAGAYIPQPFAPIYAASKAALHSYTVNLRYSLRKTPVRVVELVPPAVSTGLAGLEHQHGVSLESYCDTVFPKVLCEEADEIGYGPTEEDKFRQAQLVYKDMFQKLAGRFRTQHY